MPALARRPLVLLEAHMLRKALHARSDRQARCSDCHRAPLVGEEVFRYSGERLICALCRGRHREAPAAVEQIHHPEHGHAVKARGIEPSSAAHAA